MLKEYETESLIKFLQEDPKLRGLELDNSFFTKLRDEEITGNLFLKLTGWKFKEYGMTLKQALKLEDYIKKLGAREAKEAGAEESILNPAYSLWLKVMLSAL
ncbi:13332_t:CDS:2 [Funneliformis geosporum]|uniref:13332_t:CDS:1 n=1 Tax=Funneliformis geosporum TaxID=1117311 RepID=A0A9W4T355_9GLOM|nr:13332_t:CDS:2 [Funneliformis geosporum]